MRILVFGAGAIGSLIGGLLARASHIVTLLGRPSHMAAVRERGLQIEGIWGEHRVANLECIHGLKELTSRPFELILLTVKSYDTPAAIDAIRQFDHTACSIISVQNGY